MMVYFVILMSLIVIVSAVVLSRKQSNAPATKFDKQLQREAVHNAIIHKISKDFNVPYWNMWDASIHSIEGQFERLGRAVSENMTVLSYDDETMEATIEGSSTNIYQTSYKGCSCPDFQMRHLPCKHMYMLRLWQDENPK